MKIIAAIIAILLSASVAGGQSLSSYPTAVTPAATDFVPLLRPCTPAGVGGCPATGWANMKASLPAAVTGAGGAPIASPTFTGHTFRPVASGITAAGTTQGAATLLTADLNEVTVVGSGANAVLLPLVSVGAEIVVRNAQGTTSLLVYPPVGDAINILGTNNPDTMGANFTRVYRKMAPGKWYSQ